MRGSLHASLSIPEARDLVGRTLDLEAAYKQLVVSRRSAWASVIAVTRPSDGERLLYFSEALGFGAAAAAYGFNRFSRALCRIGCRLFKLVWTSFFDDFPHLDLSAMGSHSQDTAARISPTLFLVHPIPNGSGERTDQPLLWGGYLILCRYPWERASRSRTLSDIDIPNIAHLPDPLTRNAGQLILPSPD